MGDYIDTFSSSYTSEAPLLKEFLCHIMKFFVFFAIMTVVAALPAGDDRQGDYYGTGYGYGTGTGYGYDTGYGYGYGDYDRQGDYGTGYGYGTGTGYGTGMAMVMVT